jgi:hypothetical protein
MKLNHSIFLGLIALSLTGFAKREKAPEKVEYLPSTNSKSETKTDKTTSAKTLLPSNNFESETLGADPKSFSSAVGYWLMGVDEGNKVLVVDGRKWEEGQASANVAEKARAIYGERYAEFLDNVKAYAYFPITVANYVDGFSEGEIKVRFKPIAGKIDQAAGILFNVKPNGDYLTVRANALEENLVLFKYVKGKRSSVKWIKDVPTPTKKWQELKVTVTGKDVKGYLDGKLWLEHALDQPVSGKVGLWTKADSVTYFDDFTVNSKTQRMN